jgi:deoxyadenosine/deoxycytidine kinase
MAFKIAIEGNVASGKSSIVKYMKKNFENANAYEARTSFRVDENTQAEEFAHLSELDNINLTRIQSFFPRPNINVKLIAEPVPMWRNLNGHNLLVNQINYHQY